MQTVSEQNENKIVQQIKLFAFMNALPVLTLWRKDEWNEDLIKNYNYKKNGAKIAVL